MRRAAASPMPAPGVIALAVQALEGAEQPVGVDHVKARAIVPDEDARLAVHDLSADRDPRAVHWPCGPWNCLVMASHRLKSRANKYGLIGARDLFYKL